MTTVRVYKSDRADYRLKVRYGRKHGMPRGRGRKAWRLLDRLSVSLLEHRDTEVGGDE